MNNPHDHDFLDAVKSTLNDGARNLDAHILARLRTARSRALDAAEQRPAWFASQWFIPGAAVSTALVMAVAGLLWWSSSTDELTVAGEDSDLIAADENLDIYSDFEFYRWLADENDSV